MKLINISSESTKTHKLRSLSGNVFCFCIELNRHETKPNQKKAAATATAEKPYENITLCVLHAYIVSSKQEKKSEFIRGSPPVRNWWSNRVSIFICSYFFDCIVQRRKMRSTPNVPHYCPCFGEKKSRPSFRCTQRIAY